MPFQESFNARVIPAGNRAFGVQVTLTQGAGTSEPFTAQWESIDNQVVDGEGFLSKVVSRVFMFDRSDAVIGDVEVEPRRGDRLDVTEANGTVVGFELAPEGQMPAAELMAGGYRWLVRAKQVA